MEPVYILIRTSNRPLFFARMMETIKNQTYNNIVTIVHSDDPRDEYVTGDIVIKGTAYGPEYGNGTYNLYNNRLLNAIPNGPGWIHFIDDDDEYAAPDVIENLVKRSKQDHVNVAKVVRWDGVVFPKNWGFQKSYQTECFFIHTDHKRKGKWWGGKGGDHHYSKQLTKVLPINWIDKLLICKAQEGKGHGKRLDKGGKKIDYTNTFKPEKVIPVLGLLKHRRGKKKDWIEQGRMKNIKYGLALELEKMGIVKITHYGTQSRSAPPRQIYKF
jgi:hypothetical protein